MKPGRAYRSGYALGLLVYYLTIGALAYGCARLATWLFG
jgi:hypothetical protein